ncbi:hypothetical protein C1H76_8810 [Elsinoe australis]|uniref:Uncharacterized protein n=1 Tax=Elsinoe australis TaxID=40998 RepID=A0A4U7AR38_9PEZI|nr:hypothetical protein C1H76_8810 [Elsinoe australis]
MALRLSLLTVLFAVANGMSCNGTDECIDRKTTNNTIAPVSKHGWTKQPLERGSLDIIWSCALTLFLCSWSTICLQIPGEEDSGIEIFWRRAWLTITTLVAPEVSFCAALNQFIWAQRCVEEFRKSGFDEWTLTHAYFADQGGFVLHTSDYPPVPLDGRQLHYLVVQGYVPLPNISAKAIMDRNKKDSILRLITQLQTFWFLGNVAFRVHEGLHLASLELTTVAFVTCSATSAIFWWHKPTDVTLADVIYCDTPMVTIVANAQGHNPDGFYRYSPLEFISYQEWAWSKIWSHWINILRHLGLNLIPSVPGGRRQNTNLYPTTTTELVFMFGVSAAYVSIFLLFWNHDFPTRIELYLWRFASLDTVVLLCLAVLIDKIGFDLWPGWRDRLMACDRYRRFRMQLDWHPKGSTGRRLWDGMDRVKRACRNNTVSRHPSLDVPLKVNLPMYLIGFLYVLARAIITVLDILELRLMPESAYKQPRLMSIFPHF